MKTLIVQGSSPYTLDLTKVTCTCPDFKFRRSRADINSPNRLCKHLALHKDKLNPVSDKVRVHRSVAEKYLNAISPILDSCSNVERYKVCGSYRRGNEYVSDLDFIINVSDVEELKSLYEDISKLLEVQFLWSGDVNTSFKVDNFQIDFKVVPRGVWASSILHYTGSKYENIRLRKIANSLGYSLSEYGISNGEHCVLGLNSEEAIYKFLMEDYKPPQNR